MSVLVDKNTKLLVQGITGKTGAFHAGLSLEYGTNVVAAFEDAIARGVDHKNNPPEDFLNDVLSLLAEPQSMRVDKAAEQAVAVDAAA